MFNFEARQLFVLQPRNTGGGILSLLLSFDARTASVDFKQKNLSQKIQDWQQHLSKSTRNSHMHGHINFGSEIHSEMIKSADDADTYIHKLHFFELLSDQNQNLLSKMTGRRLSVGIYLTSKCVENLMRLRPHTDPVDYYQLWVYNNQKTILHNWFDIESLHTFPFTDLLDVDSFMDHLTYCQQCMNLDLPRDLCHTTILDWLQILQSNQKI